MSAYRIHAHRPGYRRAGRAWPDASAPAQVSRGHFSDDQWQQLEDDPNMTLETGWLDTEAHPPAVDDPSFERIQRAIAGLDADDDSVWTRAGKPAIEALEAVLGYDVTMAQREIAWERHQQSLDVPEADRASAIAQAIAGLDPNDTALWTRAGKPQIDAIEAVLGYGVSGAERDAAWEQVQAERAGAS